jgi:hypothetical protein
VNAICKIIYIKPCLSSVHGSIQPEEEDQLALLGGVRDASNSCENGSLSADFRPDVLLKDSVGDVRSLRGTPSVDSCCLLSFMDDGGPTTAAHPRPRGMGFGPERKERGLCGSDSHLPKPIPIAGVRRWSNSGIPSTTQRKEILTCQTTCSQPTVSRAHSTRRNNNR